MGSSNGCSGINKDGTTLPVGSNARATSKNESERVSLSRDLTSALSKERRMAKGNKYVYTALVSTFYYLVPDLTSSLKLCLIIFI